MLPKLGLDVVHDNGIGWQADIIQPHAGSTIALWEHNLMRIPKWRQIRFWRERRYRELEEIERRQHASRADDRAGVTDGRAEFRGAARTAA